MVERRGQRNDRLPAIEKTPRSSFNLVNREVKAMGVVLKTSLPVQPPTYTSAIDQCVGIRTHVFRLYLESAANEYYIPQRSLFFLLKQFTLSRMAASHHSIQNQCPTPAADPLPQSAHHKSIKGSRIPVIYLNYI